MVTLQRPVVWSRKVWVCCFKHLSINAKRHEGKQFTVTREMLTAVARAQRWPDVVAGISARLVTVVALYLDTFYQ